MKCIRLLLILASVLPLSGCLFSMGEGPLDKTNQLIADSNTHRLTAYADGMAGCGENAACQVGLSMAFSAGLGQQPFYKPDTAVDYLRAGLPYATLALQAYQVWGGGGVADIGRATILVKGDGNTISAGNRISASGAATLTSHIEASMVRGAIGRDGTMNIDTSNNSTTSESVADSSVNSSNNPSSTSSDSSGSNNPVSTSTETATTTTTDSSGSNNPSSTSTTTDTSTIIAPNNSVTNSGNTSTTTTPVATP